MKNLNLFCFIFLLCPLKAGAGLYTPSDVNGLFALNRHMACVVNKDVMKCYYAYHRNNGNYEVKNIKAISLASTGACVITLPDHALSCGMELPLPYKRLLISPQLNNVQQVSTGPDFTCALDDSGAHCWKTSRSNEVFKIPLPPFKNPKQVNVDPYAYSGYKFCILDDDGGYCFTETLRTVKFLPEKSPIQVALASDTICIIGTNKLECKIPFGSSEKTYNFPVNYPTKLSISKSSVCILDDDGVKCWRISLRDDKIIRYDIPDLKNPKAIAIHYQPKDYRDLTRACAIDDNGLSCWNLEDKYISIHIPNVKIDIKHIEPSIKSPSFNLDQLDTYLDLLSRVTSPVRSKFFQQLNEFVRPQLIKTQGPINDSRYLQAKLIAPAVLSLDSKFAIDSLIPRFTNSLQSIEYDTGKEDLSKIPPTSFNRRVAIQNIHAALNVLKEFAPYLKANGKINRALGQCLSNPSDENVQVILKELDLVKLELLQPNPKSAFLVEIILLAKEWLGGK